MITKTNASSLFFLKMYELISHCRFFNDTIHMGPAYRLFVET